MLEEEMAQDPEEIMQNPGDSTHGTPPEPSVLQGMLEQQESPDSWTRRSFNPGIDVAGPILRLMIWIRDRIMRRPRLRAADA